MRLTILIALAIVIAMIWFAFPSVRGMVSSSAGIHDFTVNRRPICGVHQTQMTTTIVRLELGMKAQTEMMTARSKLFPHADEPYNTGSCLPMKQKTGRVFVCPDCSKARIAWMSARPAPAN